MEKILIAYFTKTNTTKEAAERIAQVLETEGLAAEVKPMTGVKALEGYSGIVLGSPINGMRIVPEALEFSRTHAAAIAKLKCAVFAVSYMHEIARARWKNAIAKSVESWKAGTGAESSAVFGGRVESLPGIMHLMFGIPKGSPKDTRKPSEVDAWAKYLVTVFRS